MTIQYETCYSTNPEYEMFPGDILADATHGVLYNRLAYSKNSYAHTQLWFSDDYGKNWVFREENSGSHTYLAANVEGLIYRGAGAGTNIGTYRSYDYAEIFVLIKDIAISAKETGLEECELLTITGSNACQWKLYHTDNLYETYTETPIDCEYVFGNLSGLFPDIYRGGLPDEVYVHSWFPPNYEYRVSFSDDLGEAFRHIYICNDCIDFTGYASPRLITYFMSDKEPGVFYIIKQREIETPPPSWGWYMQFCVEHYKDYGETLVGTYCHDLTKDYGAVCEPVSNLTAEQYIGNSVLISWQDDSSLPVDSFLVYKKTVHGSRYTVHGEEKTVRGVEGVAGQARNDELAGRVFGNETSFLDEGLDEGTYEYYVVAYYVTGCVSDASDIATATVIGEICEPVNDLDYELLNNNNILLTWSVPEGDFEVAGYHIYKNDELVNNELVSESYYLDENLSNGSYSYQVSAVYDHCESEKSESVSVEINVGISIVQPLAFTMFPNPAKGSVSIMGDGLDRVEIFDVQGRKYAEYSNLKGTLQIDDLKKYDSGIYFVKMYSECGRVVVKRLVVN